MTMNQLDQFYTKPNVAENCINELRSVAGDLVDIGRYWFVEPSAGCGCFYQNLPEQKRIGIDIAPRKMTDINHRGILQCDYLQWQPPEIATQKYIVIGNPPFGKRANLAVQFFNHSHFADIIAFIVPVSFRKYWIHKKLNPAYQLIKTYRLRRDSFCTPDGKEYCVNAEFQIWTKLRSNFADLRLNQPPPIAHADFTIQQYNNTPAALKAFDHPFDFAVPSQGYQDYSRRETDAHQCEKNKQWLLFSAPKQTTLAALKRLDFHKLAYECATATPGFRKNDVVKIYSEEVC